jgi:hypothetical protein
MLFVESSVFLIFFKKSLDQGLVVVAHGSPLKNLSDYRALGRRMSRVNLIKRRVFVR